MDTDRTYADICYECRGYGDDYYFDSDGELVCSCDTCWVMTRFTDEDIEGGEDNNEVD